MHAHMKYSMNMGGGGESYNQYLSKYYLAWFLKASWLQILKFPKVKNHENQNSRQWKKNVQCNNETKKQKMMCDTDSFNKHPSTSFIHSSP